MFARRPPDRDLSDQTAPTLTRRGAPARAGIKRGKIPPILSTLPESQLDHLVDYWARADITPKTATVRPNLFLQHLKITLEHSVFKLLSRDSLYAHAALHALGEVASFALKSARLPAKVFKSTDRATINLDHFTQAFAERLTLSCQVDMPLRDLTGRLTAATLATIVRDTLAQMSHEHVLARQIRATALLIRKLEGKLAQGTLPDEDLYEIKLRRDLFIADLRVYNRLTRARVAPTAKQPLRPMPVALQR